jgi:hypothetical protein
VRQRQARRLQKWPGTFLLCLPSSASSIRWVAHLRCVLALNTVVHCCAFLLLSCCSVASARHVVQARRLPGPSQKLPTRSRIPGSFLEGPGSCDVLVPMPSCDGSASQTCRVMPARHKRAVHTHFYPAVLPPLLPTSICCARTTHRLFPPRRRPRANRDVEIGSMCCCARRVVIGPARAVCRVPRLLFRVALPVCRAGDEEEARAALLT